MSLLFFFANFSGFSNPSSVVRALINFCAPVKPHSVIQIYVLVARILSPAAIARTIFFRSSYVGSRIIVSLVEQREIVKRSFVRSLARLLW